MKKKNDAQNASEDEIKKSLEAMEYPDKEDIYSRSSKDKELNPDDDSAEKFKSENPDASNEKSFEDDETGADLDVPGSELDDADEEIGEEDEENNYYSLGGDNHEDLEEPKE